MGTAREFQKLDLLKRWGVIWEYVVEGSEADNDLRVTIWLTGRASEPVEQVLAGMLGGLVARERVHVVRERPPVITMDEPHWPSAASWRTRAAVTISKVLHDDDDREAERPSRD